MSVRYIIEGSGPRKEVWEIPETALKESIINALSHRDYYDKGGRTMIELFDDRVEITNPGGLVSAISQQEFGTKSSTRNPLVFGLFQRMDMVEQVGSGIRRIKTDIRKAGLPEPIFKTKGMFTIVFERPIEKTVQDYPQKTRVKTGEKMSEKMSEKIIRIINEYSDISVKDIAITIGKSSRTIEREIQKLKTLNKLKRIGPDKGGYWKVID